MKVLRVASAAATLVVCLGITGPVKNLASAQYRAPQDKRAGESASEYRATPEREQKARERTPPPRPIVPPEGQQQNPALREECAWVGQRIVGLLFRDDPATGTDFLPFYTRFGCPEDHLHKSFACVVKSGPLENEVLADRIAQCWTDPAELPEAGDAGERGAAGSPPAGKPADSGPK